MLGQYRARQLARSGRYLHRTLRRPRAVEEAAPMSITTAPTGVDQGSSRGVGAISPPPASPAPRANGPPVKPKGGRPVKHPVQLKGNIHSTMGASLQRVCLRWGIPEGIGARIAITQFLAQQDPQYRGENA